MKTKNHSTNQSGKENKIGNIDINKLEENCEYSLKYCYTSLSNMKEQGEYNFYGVIYDASFPIEESNFALLPGRKEPLTKYVCVLKLIDQSVNCLTNPIDFNEKLITLIIKTNEKEDIPFVHQIGDIIRVHRGLYSPKKKRNVYLNLLKGNQYKGSWCIFSREKSYEPYLCSNKKFTYESQDKGIIDNIRNWEKNYFDLDKSLVYSQQNNLDSRLINGSDSDLLVHVVKKVELDDQLVFFIQDFTDGCELHTYKFFNFINENDIIRIRSYKVFGQDIILLNEYGNMLKIPQNSSYHKKFISNMEKKMKELLNKK